MVLGKEDDQGHRWIGFRYLWNKRLRDRAPLGTPGNAGVINRFAVAVLPISLRSFSL